MIKKVVVAAHLGGICAATPFTVIEVCPIARAPWGDGAGLVNEKRNYLRDCIGANVQRRTDIVAWPIDQPSLFFDNDCGHAADAEPAWTVTDDVS